MILKNIAPIHGNNLQNLGSASTLIFVAHSKITSKIENKNLQHQDQNCKAVSEYTEGEPILFRNYNSRNKWEKGIVQKKIGCLHYLIKYNNKVVKETLGSTQTKLH